MTDWYCTFHYPTNWIEVVHEPGGGVADRVQLAIERTFPQEAPDKRDELAATAIPLVQHDAERDAAVSAHGYDREARGGGVHMHLAMWVTRRSVPGSVDEDLRLLGDTVREAGVNVGAPEVSEVSLQAGRALRVRQIDQVSRDEGMTAELVDGVDYWIPVEASADMLWVNLWTADIGAADDVVPLFDQIAGAMVLETS